MKPDTHLALTVNVSLSGSGNAARIQGLLGHAISASSTQSPELAVERAVEKLIARNQFGAVAIKTSEIYRNLSRAAYLVTLDPVP